MSRSDILDQLKSGNIDYVRVEFIDILGNTRARSLRRAEFEEISNGLKGVLFPESLLILDYQDRPIKSKYDDVIAIPDLNTFVMIPYLERTARVLSFMNMPDGTPSPYCSRTILKKATQSLEELGFRMHVSFEPTFYLLKENTMEPADSAKAFSPEGLMEEQNFLRNMIKNLENVGVQVELINKHYGPGQYEVSFAKMEAMESADSLIAAREVIRDTTRLFHMYSTFMPKPFKQHPGSSMDVYFSLTSLDGKDVLYDPNDKNGFSSIAYSFLGGIMEHLPSIMAFAAPTVNSYKRFREVFTPSVPGVGSERHFMIRVPSNFRDARSLEFRLADPLTNSYLFLASMIFAGIDGIKNGLSVDVNTYTNQLPSTLKEALEKLENDSYMMYSLGQEIHTAYLELKNSEIETYEREITPWEINTYLKAGW
ncbi:glutamine synthetase family protein [Sulfuracidifex metallicus]|uniref:Glutamine synthetase n=1 Tax=Sulfuracidifex metallicus DSM 6482 = JCM 9184 TaxID=523847 RepID=A0A6A9QN59_SULME|nr:glutamine synthetase family protein [Sulfuracidifex metallicus]MUN29168.1 glutamine synthetase [Sulfuracidifex metallicus DSM 6482 = JCM 9184]WOE50310.1 glutamine synthetase family protein [Sulfuracidifex metallicus DSM 6482 = JCM 9184]